MRTHSAWHTDAVLPHREESISSFEPAAWPSLGAPQARLESLRLRRAPAARARRLNAGVSARRT